MHTLLDFFAHTHTPYLHARGRNGTAALIQLLQPVTGQRILELGFGTGQTLVELAACSTGLELFGVEKSPLMLAVAQKRLRFCGLRNISLSQYEHRLPYPDQFFDTVYCESVLAIVPDAELPALFLEIFRVLKTGGRLVCNESLWLPDVPADTVREINRRCLEAFGIVQASERYGYPESWQRLGEQAEFELEYRKSLKYVENTSRFRWNAPLFLSGLFSVLGRLKRTLAPRLRVEERCWRAQEKGFEGYGEYLEGWLFGFNRKGQG